MKNHTETVINITHFFEIFNTKREEEGKEKKILSDYFHTYLGQKHTRQYLVKLYHETKDLRVQNLLDIDKIGLSDLRKAGLAQSASEHSTLYLASGLIRNIIKWLNKK